MRALGVIIVAVLMVGIVSLGTGTWRDRPQPTAVPAVQRPATRPAANLPWGGRAHEAVASSRDCADLQSWFDSADFQRGVLLDRLGNDDPGYRYAFDVMMQADDRMRAVGCYD